MEERRKNETAFQLVIWIFLISGCLCVIFIIILAVGAVKCTRSNDIAKYNGGRCECGGNYIFQQVITHNLGDTYAYDKDYIYICDNCGKMIKLETYIPERK